MSDESLPSAMGEPSRELVTSGDLKPYLRLVHDFPGDGPFELKDARVLDHALHYFVLGSGTYRLNGASFPIEPGLLVLVRPGELFSIHTQSGRPFRMLNIHFDPVEMPDSASISWPYPQTDIAVRSTPGSRLAGPMKGLPGFSWRTRGLGAANYEIQFQEVRRWYDFARASGDPAAGLRERGSFLILLATLLTTGNTVAEKAEGSLDGALDRAVELLRARYAEPLRLENVAREVGLSPSHLSLLFSRRYGAPPMKYLTHLRLAHARNELAFSDRPVKEIAARVGYQSVAHFTRAFHREFHAPPATYRTRNTPED